VLTGIDDVPWAALEIPGLLRSAASKDADVADQAREGLDESLFYLGSVFPATAAAVPFLAALARGARHGRAELLWLLGAVADPAHADGDALPAIRRALATQLPIPVTLLTDKASAVREAAAYAAARAGVTAGRYWIAGARRGPPRCVRRSLWRSVKSTRAGRSSGRRPRARPRSVWRRRWPCSEPGSRSRTAS
jgi:hypothetical protein